MSQNSQNISKVHQEEIDKVVALLSKITSRSPEEIKPYVDELLLRLRREPSPQANHFYNTATHEEWLAEFHQWIDSHKGRNIPVLSEEAMSRESIYEERG